MVLIEYFVGRFYMLLYEGEKRHMETVSRWEFNARNHSDAHGGIVG